MVDAESDFATRWNAWVARGRVHERRVRVRCAISAVVLAAGAAIFYGVFRL